MKNKDELIEMVKNICEMNGWYYLIGIDDGETIHTSSHAITNSRLDHMVTEVNKFQEHVTITKT